jgi:hypothetical protein
MTGGDGLCGEEFILDSRFRGNDVCGAGMTGERGDDLDAIGMGVGNLIKLAMQWLTAE